MSPQNPYPGPVPLKDRYLLKGRDHYLDRFIKDLLNDIRIMEMHGRSGVGKSSFLGAGVTPRLEAVGFAVATVSAWEQVATGRITASGEPGSPDVLSRSPEELWVAAVDLALEKTAPLYRPPPGTSPHEYLALLAPVRNLVLVFDQLEELFRSDEAHGRTLGRRFLEYVAEVAKDDRFSFVQILSLRSEHISELVVPIEQNVVAARWRIEEIPPVDFASTVPEVIRVDENIDDAVAKEIARSWNLAAYGSSDVPKNLADISPSIGLLELQAFLWSKAEAAGEAGETSITLGYLRSEAENSSSGDWTAVSDGQMAARSYTDGIQDYIGRSLDVLARKYHEEEAGHNVDDCIADDCIAEQRGRETKLAAASIAPHLSSAGFKLVQDTDALASIAVQSTKDLRLARLDHTPDSNGLPAGVKDLLVRAGLIHEAGAIRRDETAHLRSHEAAVREAAHLCRIGGLEDEMKTVLQAMEYLWADDTSDGGPKARLSGRMTDGTPLVATIELVANYERALQWLTSSHVIRLTPTANGHRVAALIHDGFGTPFEQWGREHRAKPESVLSSIVAISGETVIDSSPDTPLSRKQLLGGTVSRVRWLGCEIRASFKDVVFKDCDFRGSILFDSTFENVEFVNCNLWGVLFLKSTLKGCRISGGVPLQTLTFRECKLAEGGLTIYGAAEGSYGLFLDRVSGGPWSIESCDGLTHVSFSGDSSGQPEGKNLDPGRISNSSITHFSFGDAVDPGTVVVNSTVRHISGEKGKLVDDGDASPDRGA